MTNESSTNSSSTEGQVISPPSEDAVSSVQPSASSGELPKASSGSKWLGVLLVLALSALVVWSWMQQQKLRSVQGLLQSGLTEQQAHLTQLQQQLQQGLDQQQWQTAVSGIDKRIAGISHRLQSVESTSRDDWLLAEAEYLLRLAGQRMLMERGTSGAVALLESADNILRDLSSDELFPVRQQLARDLTSLKLSPSVDRSGLYLQLSALSEQVETLSDLPGDMGIDSEPVPLVQEKLEIIDAIEEPSLWQRVQHHFWSAMGVVGEHIRIRHHDQTIVPILPPESSAYLRQNVRLSLEQAQLALLRENTAVFQQSLKKAESLIRTYFGSQDKGLLLANELAVIATQDVKVELPDISGSLIALQEVLNRLHKLEGSLPQTKALNITSEKGASL